MKTRQQIIDTTRCPKCDARVGEKCKGTDGRGKHRKVHQERWDHDRLLTHLEGGVT